jgi:transcriptional regulator with XRE-family HTH domain
MNQQSLADKLGLAFQQVQKYEAGANRVSASALSTIADALRVPVSFFFADSPIDHDARMERPETIELLRCYYGFANDQVRQHFLELVKVAAAAGKAQSRGRRRATVVAVCSNADDLRANVIQDREHSGD